MTHELLSSIANEKGGGLSIQVSGKYTSVRHELAKADGKLTAGEAAKKISKELKRKISAKELVAAYKLLNDREPEWHHAGFYKMPGKKSTMGRTFFLTENEINNMIDRWSLITIKQAAIDYEKKVAAETMVAGFYYYWDYDYSGHYGKKRNHKVLGVYEGSELNQPKNLTPCNSDELECAKLFVGRKYYGWDEPTIGEFSKEKMDAEIARRKKVEEDKLLREIQAEKNRKLEIESQTKVNELLNEMESDLISQGVDFNRKNAAWYIYSKFIEGTANQILFSVGKINNWICNRK